MKHRLISFALMTAVLLLGSNLAVAADTQAAASQAATSKAKVSTKTTKSAAAAKPKAAVEVKLVDINTAGIAELAKLPGLTEEEAAKIVAGRPYGSKSWLVSKKVLAEDKFQAIRHLIIARQLYTDAAKNAALYNNKKK